MALAATIPDSTPLIEEHVDTGLREFLAEYRPSYVPGGPVDELEDRYTIHTSKRIAPLSHNFADAYEVTDKNTAGRALYAMVCTPELPYRMQAITDAQHLNHSHLQVPVSFGTVRLSSLGASRFVLVFEKPTGSLLSEMIGNQTRMHETKVISTLLEPACNALIALRDRKIHHGNIRPENFFLGSTAVLGECYSAACGTLNHFLYQPLERMMCDPMGFGEADEKSDVYALAVMVIEAMYGLDRLRGLSRDEFIQKALEQGSYQVFASNRDFTPSMLDFFRGALTDNFSERWTLEQVQEFVQGKRFNLTAPTSPKDAARPFLFADQSILSRRLLAHLLHRHWREAVKDIRSLFIDRWCETSLHRPELAEQVERALKIGGDRTASERQVSDMMTRIMVALDPFGPLRAKTLSLRPDAIALMLACLAGTDEPELWQLLNFIESDVSTFWSEQNQTSKTPHISQVIWRLQRVKPYLKNRTLGFGLERALYEMNPTLPCQSELLREYHVTTAEDALRTLDALSKTRSESSFIDRHLAAFLAAKIDMTKPVKMTDLSSLIGLQTNAELLMLRIISKTQQKYPSLKLPGLAAWTGMHIERMMNEIHNRALRKEQKLKLKRRVTTGMVQEMLMPLLNREVGDHDTDGFVHAMAQHEINYKRIEYLKNPKLVQYRARKHGSKLAATISFAGLMMMVCHLIAKAAGV